MSKSRITLAGLKTLPFLATFAWAPLALATSSAELYSSASYGYGRVEARVRYAAGDGVVSSVFLWKDGSEQAGMFWNELDFEKLGAQCRLETNPIFGNPSANHSQKHALELDMCGAFHTYAYEWTPEAIVWSIDGMEIRRETGATAQAFADNASGGMQIHLNVWPGDASFGGNFDPAILPVHEYVDWVQFSKYDAGAFTLAWREDFTAAALPQGWLTGNWASPKNLSKHAPENVNFIDGYAVLSLTADNALGPAGAMPEGGSGNNGGAGSASSNAAGASTAGAASPAGGTGVGGNASASGSPSHDTGGTPTAGSTNGLVPTSSATNTAPRSGGCSLGSAPVSRTTLWPFLASALLWCVRKGRRERSQTDLLARR